MRYQYLIPLTIICLLPLGLSACSEKTQSDPRTFPPLVSVTVVKEANTEEPRTFTGVIKARIESNLGFRVSGKVTKRFVDAGQQVKRGQLLMQIDDSDLQLAENAQHQAVQAASAQAQQAIKDEKRYRDLLGSGAISTAAYDQVKANSDAAQAQLSSARAQAKVSSNASGYANLVADHDGTIMETLAEPGQVISAGQPVIRLANAGEKEAVIQLPETVRLPIGFVGQATVFGKEDTNIPAKLRQLSNTADSFTRTFEARFVLEGASNQLPLGTTVTIHLDNEQKSSQSTFKVPLGAVLDNGKKTGVWSIEHKTQKVKWNAIHIIRVDDEYAYVTGQLQQGEKIVALGAHLLKEGQAVRESREISHE